MNDMKGTARDVQIKAKRVFQGMLPAIYAGWIPPLWKELLQPNVPKWFGGFYFHMVFLVAFPWLVGPMEGAEYEDVEVPEQLRRIFSFLPEVVSVPTAIKAERCRVLESSGCASVCVNSCKVPSQEWIKEEFGMDVHVQPNYDDFSCVWSFNKGPPPLEEDAAIMVPCFTNCPSALRGEGDALRQAIDSEYVRSKAKARVGSASDSINKYAGETLEAIASRASKQAMRDAAATVADGTAYSDETFKERVESAESAGKCWSVDSKREVV